MHGGAAWIEGDEMRLERLLLRSVDAAEVRVEQVVGARRGLERDLHTYIERDLYAHIC